MTKPLTPGQDAYGRLMLDCFEGRPAAEIIERDDGLIMVNRGPQGYFEAFDRWPEPERKAMRWVRGRVLDVGCGPGRVALYLQRRGLEVVGIDLSPQAIEVARAQGVRDARLMSLDEVGSELGFFDTVVMLGNNFGLFRSARSAKSLLRRIGRVTVPTGRILAASRNPFQTDDPVHLAYHERNRARGRMSGQARLRVRHRAWSTPWFDYLMVSPEEMDELAQTGGWHVHRVLSDETPIYVGVLVKS